MIKFEANSGMTDFDKIFGKPKNNRLGFDGDHSPDPGFTITIWIREFYKKSLIFIYYRDSYRQPRIKQN